MKRGGFLKRTPLSRQSDKKRKQMATRVRPGTTCELCPVLEGPSWEAFAAKWHQPFFETLEPHHVWVPPRWDEPANVITACHVSHRFCHTHLRFGRLVCTWVMVKAKRFDRELIREKWHRDPIDYLHALADADDFWVPREEWEPFWLVVSQSF